MDVCTRSVLWSKVRDKGRRYEALAHAMTAHRYGHKADRGRNVKRIHLKGMVG